MTIQELLNADPRDLNDEDLSDGLELARIYRYCPMTKGDEIGKWADYHERLRNEYNARRIYQSTPKNR